MSKYIIGLAILCQSVLLSAQTTWSLEQCLDYVVQNHPSSTQAALDMRSAALDYQLEKNNRLPSLNANTNLGMQFGRTIDPTTNTFDSQNSWYNSWSINGNWMAFSGDIKHRIAEQEERMIASKWQTAETAFLLKVDVIAAYYACLLAEARLEQAKINVNSFEEQVKNLEIQVSYGTRSTTDRLELEAQLTQNQQAQAQAKYQVTAAYTNLKRVLFLPAEQQLNIEKIEIETETPLIEQRTALSEHLQAQYPGLLRLQSEIKSAEHSIQTAKSGRLPEVGAFAQINTYYSSRDMSTNYLQQLNQYLGQGIGAYVSVPILDQGRTKLSVQRAEIALKRSQVALEQTKQDLNIIVQQLLQDVDAAWAILETAKQNVALQERLLNSKKRAYELGSASQLEYLIVQNQQQAANQSYLLSLYDYNYKKALVAFYREN